MAARKEKLKMLLQKVEPDVPATDFTEQVMKEISTDANLEIPINLTLQGLLKQHGMGQLTYRFYGAADD
jgi:hypothetical protein